MKQELSWALRPFPPLIPEAKRKTHESMIEYLDYAVEATQAGTKYGDFYAWAVNEGLNKDHRFFAKLLQAFKSAQWDRNGQWASVGTDVTERLETAMRPYKPKMQPRRLKNDPEHRLIRQALKHRTSGQKTLEQRKDKLYYKKNKNQLLQRNKRSRQLHKRPAAASILSAIYARLAQAT